MPDLVRSPPGDEPHIVAAPRPTPRRDLALLALFLVATLGAGVLLRWDLAAGLTSGLGIVFSDLRHAHSHIGFYGLLTIAWWLVARERTGRSFAARTTHLYAAAVAVTSGLFAFMGYAAPTIALSTLIAGFWVVAAWRQRRAPGWLAVAPWGVVLGMLLIPAIAVTSRRDFELSRQLAHVFVAAMLLLTFVPVALAALRVPRVPTPAWLATTTVGSTYLVFASTWPWPLGLLLALAGALLALCLRRRLTGPWWLVAAWWGLALGLVLIGLVPPLQTEPMRLVALHYTVLGPIALTLLHHLAPDLGARHPALLLAALAALGAMLAAMLAEPLVGHVTAMTIAAWAGSALALLATTLVSLACLRSRRRGRERLEVGELVARRDEDQH